MYVIMAYDVNAKRVQKVLKIGRKYLLHVQNSVLQGELSAGQFKQLKEEVNKVIESSDAIRFYTLKSEYYVKVETMGEAQKNTSWII